MRIYPGNNQVLQNAIALLDPDARIAAIAPASLPNPLPAANKGEYFYFNAAGTITLYSLSYQINPGDRLWCNTDETTAGQEINWEVIAAPDAKSPYYIDPVKSVVVTLPAIASLTEGDRVLLKSSPPVIKQLKGGSFVDQSFPDGAIAQVVGQNLEVYRLGNAIAQRTFDTSKPSKASTNYYVNANTGSDLNNGESSVTAFATVNRALAELQKYYWTDVVGLTLEGATLFNTPITLSGIGVDAANGISIRIGVTSTTTDYINTLTVTDFSVVGVKAQLAGNARVIFKRIGKVDITTGTNNVRIRNITATTGVVFQFEDIGSVEMNAPIRCEGTINVTNSLFEFLSVGYAYVDLSFLDSFVAPRNIGQIVFAANCFSIQVEHSAFSFNGMAYALDSARLAVSDYYGIEKLAGTIPDDLYGGFSNNPIFDFATSKLINYDNTTSGLVAQNYQDAIDELKTQLNSVQSINVETITADKQLQNNAARIQDLTNPSTTQRNILLPTTPALAKEFIVINEANSIGSFLINGSVVAPSYRYAIAWNGNKWLEL
jgi:hypothetical protein